MQKALLGIATMVLAALVLVAIITVRHVVEPRSGSAAGSSIVLAHPTPDPHP